MSRVFANGLGDWSPIPSRVISVDVSICRLEDCKKMCKERLLTEESNNISIIETDRTTTKIRRKTTVGIFQEINWRNLAR